jgi:two-component sensor histidine kinase
MNGVVLPIANAAEFFPLQAWVKPMFRPSQTRDVITESDAHASLLGGFSSSVPTDPHQVVEIIRRLFKADAAGIYACPIAVPESIYSGNIIVGALAMHESAQPPIGRGLYTMCINAGAPIVLSRQEIELTYLRHIRPRIAHMLIAPLYDGAGKPVGTTWLAQTNSPMTYSRVDVLMLERLTHVLAAGLAVSDQTRELQQLRLTLESERATHSAALVDSIARSKRSLGQSELSVREAHHRVKNTLQVASSLLSLQARATQQGEARDALREASVRLQVLTHGHEHLYKAALSSQDISVADLLHFIAKVIPPSFAEVSPSIQLNVVATEILMPPADACAVALIANEVVTNVYKHAFPNDTTGCVTVQLTREFDDTVMLRIADTGRGFTAQPSSETFGLFVVRKLGEQLNATVEFDSVVDADGSGTVFTLRVPAAIESGPLLHCEALEKREPESIG